MVLQNALSRHAAPLVAVVLGLSLIFGMSTLAMAQTTSTTTTTTPGTPNTGAGGVATSTLVILGLAAVVALAGAAYLGRRSA